MQTATGTHEYDGETVWLAALMAWFTNRALTGTLGADLVSGVQEGKFR